MDSVAALPDFGIVVGGPGGVPQAELQQMTHAQLIQCANTFYSGWVGMQREAERSHQRLQWALEVLSVQKDESAKEIASLRAVRSALEEELNESVALGRALHRRVAHLTLACGSSEAGTSPSTEVILKDQLVSAQARILSLERVLRQRVSLGVNHIMDENVVLREQRARDVASISSMTERLTSLESAHRNRGAIHSAVDLGGVAALSSPVVGTGVTRGPPVGGFAALSRGCQTEPAVHATLDTHTTNLKVRRRGNAIESHGDSVILERRLRALEAALVQKEELLRDLNREADNGGRNLGEGVALAERFHREIADRDGTIRELNDSVQRMMDRYNALSSETAELRIALHEARASRSRLSAEMKESRMVSPSRLHELLKMEDSFELFEAERHHYQQRDRLCSELEVSVRGLKHEIVSLRQAADEMHHQHSAVLEECLSLREGIRMADLECASLRTRLGIAEQLGSHSSESVGVQTDLEIGLVADLKCQLTMSMNDSRYLEHEALIRELYLQACSRMANDAFGLCVKQHSEIVRLQLSAGEVSSTMS